MQVSIIKRGKQTQIFLTPEGELEKAALKEVEGGTFVKVSPEFRISELNLSDAIVLTNNIGNEKTSTSSNTSDTDAPRYEQ